MGKLCSRKQRIVDYTLYLLVSIAVVMGGIAFAVYTKPTTRFPARWIWLAAATALLFWQTIIFFRRRWGSTRFWMTVGSLLLVHTVVYVVVFEKYEHVPLLLLGFSLALEFFALWLILSKVAFKLSKRWSVRRDRTRSIQIGKADGGN
jgi:hypothetical protein